MEWKNRAAPGYELQIGHILSMENLERITKPDFIPTNGQRPKHSKWESILFRKSASMPFYNFVDIHERGTSFFLHLQESVWKPESRMSMSLRKTKLSYSGCEVFVEEKETHKPGERRMIHGPTYYVPRVECIDIDIIEKRRTIPLDKNKGIYVRNIETSCVRGLWVNRTCWSLMRNFGKDVSRDRKESGRIGTRDDFMTNVVVVKTSDHVFPSQYF